MKDKNDRAMYVCFRFGTPQELATGKGSELEVLKVVKVDEIEEAVTGLAAQMLSHIHEKGN